MSCERNPLMPGISPTQLAMPWHCRLPSASGRYSWVADREASVQRSTGGSAATRKVATGTRFKRQSEDSVAAIRPIREAPASRALSLWRLSSRGTPRIQQENRSSIATLKGTRGPPNSEKQVLLVSPNYSSAMSSRSHFHPYCRSEASFPRTSSTTSVGADPLMSACRARQSRHFTWSARITPDTVPSAGRSTSNGYPFRWLVIGQQRASPTFRLYASGERIKTGRRPACSCPAWGLRLIQTMSPRAGATSFSTTILSPSPSRDRFRYGGFRESRKPAAPQARTLGQPMGE